MSTLESKLSLVLEALSLGVGVMWDLPFICSPRKSKWERQIDRTHIEYMYIYIYIYAHTHIYMAGGVHVNSGTQTVGRGQQTPWSWGNRQL